MATCFVASSGFPLGRTKMPENAGQLGDYPNELATNHVTLAALGR